MARKYINNLKKFYHIMLLGSMFYFITSIINKELKITIISSVMILLGIYLIFDVKGDEKKTIERK